jgi:hypothetical protein
MQIITHQAPSFFTEMKQGSYLTAPQSPQGKLAEGPVLTIPGIMGRRLQIAPGTGRPDVPEELRGQWSLLLARKIRRRIGDRAEGLVGVEAWNLSGNSSESL